MRLISKYKDFYDHFAHDRSLSDHTRIWTRKPHDHKINFAIPPLLVHSGRWGAKLENSEDFIAIGFIVWFCGKAFPVLWVKYLMGSPKIGWTETSEYFYSYNAVPERMRGKPEKKREKKYSSYFWNLQDFFNINELWHKDDRLFADHSLILRSKKAGLVVPKISFEEMHRQVGSPVFCHPYVIEDHRLNDEDNKNDDCTMIYRCTFTTLKPKVLVNPNLSLIQFHKAMDAFTAFTSLERYLANEMAPVDARKDLPIPDKLKVETHGFDVKKSFRKMPRD